VWWFWLVTARESRGECGNVDEAKGRWGTGKSKGGAEVRTLTVGAEEEEGSDCLRLETVVGLVADAGYYM
jgi:hypothetical protein